MTKEDEAMMESNRAKELSVMHAKRSRAQLARWNAKVMGEAADAIELESTGALIGYVGVHGAINKLRELAGVVKLYANELDPPAFPAAT